MRADRLLRMLMILQSRGPQVARELANDLEVSVRTVYRDVTALSTAGVPVYTEKGPGGGIRLIEEYRTSLTGLSPEEVQALFMLNIPAALSSLGMKDEVQGAMLKLSAALPKYLQEAETGVRQRIMIDLDWWRGAQVQSPAYLRELYRAIWENRVLKIEVLYSFGYRFEHQVQAYSLVSRGQSWYLICRVGGFFKVFSTEQIQSLEVTEDTFLRDPGFDLSAFWRNWTAEQENDPHGYRVQLSVSGEALALLQRNTAVVVLDLGPDPAAEHRYLITVEFGWFEEARRVVLDLGGAARVISPEALRATVADYARQILSQYSA